MAAVHRITIVTALLGAIAYTAWEVNEWRLGAGPWAAVMSLAGLVATGVIALYLRSLRGRLAEKLTPVER